MKKWELIGLTLEQLLEQHKQTPESFEYADKDYPVTGQGGNPLIYWQPKVDLKSSVVPDPNESQKAVIITYNELTGRLVCYIYSNIVPGLKAMEGRNADATVIDDRKFMKWRSNWHKFNKLAEAIKEHDRSKENDTFLKKLFSIFPGTLDKHLLGD
jgi:hypothetical protein